MLRKLVIKVRFGLFVVSAIVALAFALSPAQARADEVSLVGSTSGYFNAPGTTSLNGGGLSFTNVAYFNTNTVGGTAALVLGSFFLSASPTYYNYGGNNFTINVNFTSPSLTGVSSTAQVVGNVSLNNGGVWIVQWSQPDLTVGFTNSSGNLDSFDLALNSVSLMPNTNALLTGFVNYTGTGGGAGGTVPEPPTMVLSGLGIASLFLLKKRLLLA